MGTDVGASWSSAETAELYEVGRWGRGYFVVGENGNLQVRPRRDSPHTIDLKELIDQLEVRGLDLPILLRFNGLLEDRIRRINDAFQRALTDNEYTGKYCCVYPIKVNQQRSVVQKVVEYGREFGFGLEAGSKPELLAVVAMTDPETPIICNGFKDDEFVEMALRAQQIGRHVIPIVEKFTEIELILKHAKRLGVRPQIGMRVKLATRGSGRWQSSGGYRSKFGLTVSEVLSGLELLDSQGMSDCFHLLHFHLGSQITNIRMLKGAVNEAARIYVELKKRGAGLKYLDVGGGLGVDYDGSQTNFESSMNYTLQEYANDVVFHIGTVCRDAEVPEPDIITESGRAIAAFHAALIFETLGVSEQGGQQQLPDSVPDDYEQPLHTLAMTLRDSCVRNVVESFHDAQQALETAMNLFSAGFLSLEQRVTAEEYFFRICRKIRELTLDLEFVPEELRQLDRLLSDTYFCNFSLFQSMPDSWAISQLFPIMPVHRLDEKPDRKAVLADITCDSDGKIDAFIHRRDVKKTLDLHSQNGEPYYLGAFLVGAYQEILGDLHNLFGDTNMVHVDLQTDGKVTLGTVLKGETVAEVLDYVEFDPRDLTDRMQADVERAVREKLIDYQQAGEIMRFYEEGLSGYTYLEKSTESD
jgi:arginine decarboxylase